MMWLRRMLFTKGCLCLEYHRVHLVKIKYSLHNSFIINNVNMSKQCSACSAGSVAISKEETITVTRIRPAIHPQRREFTTEEQSTRTKRKIVPEMNTKEVVAQPREDLTDSLARGTKEKAVPYAYRSRGGKLLEEHGSNNELPRKDDDQGNHQLMSNIIYPGIAMRSASVPIRTMSPQVGHAGPPAAQGSHLLASPKPLDATKIGSNLSNGPAFGGRKYHCKICSQVHNYNYVEEFLNLQF
ncbi:hypothetical protein DMENIID0001_025240 [Sergentomyia squamirostris]